MKNLFSCFAPETVLDRFFKLDTRYLKFIKDVLSSWFSLNYVIFESALHFTWSFIDRHKLVFSARTNENGITFSFAHHEKVRLANIIALADRITSTLLAHARNPYQDAYQSLLKYFWEWYFLFENIYIFDKKR